MRWRHLKDDDGPGVLSREGLLVLMTYQTYLHRHEQWDELINVRI